MKLKLLIVALFCSVLGWGQVTIFSENMYNGTGGANSDAISTHETNNRFNEDALTYSGTGDMRTSNPSLGYAGFSGTWNVMLNTSGETLIIDGINASAYTSLVLNFGIGKAANAPNGSTIIVEYSTTGTGGTFTAVTWPLLPTGTGTSYGTTYYYRSTTSVIPSNVTTIRFRTTSTEEYRLDDISLQGILASSNTITTNNPLEVSPFCVSASAGASVSVPFTSVGTFNASNTFTAQLSNASGVFPGTTIGTLGASGVDPSGTITATIPANTPTGTGYRIRVVSNDPTVIGSTTAAFTINLANNSIAPVATQNIATAANGATLTVTEASTPSSRQWYYATVNGGP